MESSGNEVSGVGFIVGIVAWVLIIFLTVTQAICTEQTSCGTLSIFFFRMISVGMIAPAWTFAVVVTALSMPKP